MIVLKNLSSKSVHPEHYFSEQDEKVDINWILKAGQHLTEEESTFILRLNDILFRCEKDKEFQKKVQRTYLEEVYISPNLPRLHISTEAPTDIKCENLTIYYLTKLKDEKNIEPKEFERLISEQNIQNVFCYETFDHLEQPKIVLQDFKNLFEKTFIIKENLPIVDLIFNTVKEDIDCYNNLLNKVNFNLPVCKKYLCIFNGLNLITEISSYHMNNTMLAFLLILMHYDKVMRLIEEERSNKIKELDNKAQEQIASLKIKILSDPSFQTCARKDAIKYLKSLIKSLCFEENGLDNLDCVFEKLELSITQTGIVRCNGYAAQKFIDELWAESRNRL